MGWLRLSTQRQGHHLLIAVSGKQTQIQGVNIIFCQLIQIFNFWFGCWEKKHNRIVQKKPMTIKTLRKKFLLPPSLDSALLFPTRFLYSRPAVTAGKIWSLHKGHKWCRGVVGNFSWLVFPPYDFPECASQELQGTSAPPWNTSSSDLDIPPAVSHTFPLPTPYVLYLMFFPKCPFSEARQTCWWSAVGKACAQLRAAPALFPQRPPLQPLKPCVCSQ